MTVITTYIHATTLHKPLTQKAEGSKRSCPMALDGVPTVKGGRGGGGGRAGGPGVTYGDLPLHPPLP